MLGCGRTPKSSERKRWQGTTTKPPSTSFDAAMNSSNDTNDTNDSSLDGNMTSQHVTKSDKVAELMLNYGDL